MSVEYEATLRRAFVDCKADFIRLDGRSGPFLFNTAKYGQDKGWLGPAAECGDEQWTEYHIRLTDDGRRHFGLEISHA